MIGAIAGDIAGSRFEWHNIKTKDFELFTPACHPTDDSVMTLAVAEALLAADGDLEKLPGAAVDSMQAMGRMHPDAGYGGRFRRWLWSEDARPYGSFGNGAAMRVSPCGWAGATLEETAALARAVTAVTHNSPEGLAGAGATAAAIWIARSGGGKKDIRDYVEAHCFPLGFTLDAIREDYRFDVSCQGSVPQAIEAFLEAEDFEDAIRNAISIGGDSDTIAAITGGIAEAFFGVPDGIRDRVLSYLDAEFLDILERFEEKHPPLRA